jgi:hypothetical protein
MATYYIRTDGSDSNAGTGPATNQAWQTIGKVFGAASVVTGGDIVYIAPGTYTEKITVAATSPTSQVQIVGNPTASQFSGVSPGFVKLSSFNTAGTAAVFSSSFLISATGKDYYSFSNMIFEENMGGSPDSGMVFLESRYISFNRCVFTSNSTAASPTASMLRCTAKTSTALDLTVENCVFAESASYHIQCVGQSISTDTTVIRNCLFLSCAIAIYPISITAKIFNCAIIGGNLGVYQTSGSANATVTVTNCLFKSLTTAIQSTTGNGTQTYNRFVACSTSVNNVPTSITSTTTGVAGVEQFFTQLTGLSNLQPYTSYLNSPNTSFGTATGAPSTDMYGVTWNGTSPDAGAGTYRLIGSVSPYIPSERNASTITIAPGSTSQSIELYLGATGLTASTSGLSARYNRTRTASVSIPLVARTIAQAWTAGGFAEVDATNMPGVYRLDLPDAALAAGADDVTIVVRGASGTNGAVMTVKLSSGGLTSAQTASAVWGADPSPYNDATTLGGVLNQTSSLAVSTDATVNQIPNLVWDELTGNHDTHGSFGYNILRADQASKEGLVTLHQSGGVSRVDADIHAIQNDTDAATELKGALLHNGTDYISAELLTPVSAATSVHIGPYQLLADGLGADQPLDVNVGTATSIDVQVTDANGTGIDITGATVTAKVYNAGGTLVATYSGTATYADNGRLSFGLTTTVTNTSGTYTVTVTRTTGATDTQVFGPLKLYVRPV